MKRRFNAKILFISFVMLVTTSINSYAAPVFANNYNSVNNYSKILPPSVEESIVKESNVQRGVFFAAADLQIRNRDGQIGVVSHSYMNVPVDEVYMTIYLDRLIKTEDQEYWSQVAYYDFEFYAEDYPDGLNLATVDFIIKDQPKDYYYRLRGQYSAFKDGAMEGFGPVTDGVLIE